YNPFEFAGAISQWRVELMKDKELRQFDYETISDVVLHIRYTARDGGGRLETAAGQSLKDAWSGSSDTAQPLVRLFSAKREFPSEWSRFANSPDATPRLQIVLQNLHFPFPFRNSSLQVARIGLFAKRKDSTDPLNLWLIRPDQDETAIYDSET